MNRKKKKKFSVKYILLIMTVFCIIVIGCSSAYNMSSGAVGKIAGHVIIPMQKGLNKVGSVLHIQKEDFTSKKELQKENGDLKEQVASLEERLNRTALEQSELEKLRKLYDMDQSYDTYEKAAANVVGKDASNVSATDVATSDNCIVSGSLKSMNERQQLEITDLKDSDDQVKAGDQIVTSNISDRYLPGIPIGYITDITQDSSSLTKTGYLATIVDFEHLDKVLVIKQVKDYSEAN